MQKWVNFKFFLNALFLLFAISASAGEIEPRSYVNTPIDINVAVAGYVYSDGGLATSDASSLQDANLKMDTGVLAYVRTFDVCGNSAKFDVIAPYSKLAGSALDAGQPRERNVSGLNDPRFRFSVNFYGSPALSVQEFANYQQDLLIGASVQVSAPLGQYDPNRLVNLGHNRWSIKPDIGISKALGALTLELSAGVTLFTDNDDYYGGRVQERDAVYSTQLHATYNFGGGVWAALSGTYDYGGRTIVDGVRQHDVQSNSRLGATLALPVDKNNSIKLYASTAVVTHTGSDYDLVGALWQYRWGNGL